MGSVKVTRIEGGVTAAKGFSAASTAARIKYEGRTDMAMIYSASPCTAAGTFTRNVVKAAPVIWDCCRRQFRNRQCLHRAGGTGLLQTDRGSSGSKSADPCRFRSGRIHRCHRLPAAHRPHSGRCCCTGKGSGNRYRTRHSGGKGHYDNRYPQKGVRLHL